MDLVHIVDEDGNIMDGYVAVTSSGEEIAVVGNLYLWPETFCVVTDSQVGEIRRADARARLAVV